MKVEPPARLAKAPLIGLAEVLPIAVKACPGCSLLFVTAVQLNSAPLWIVTPFAPTWSTLAILIGSTRSPRESERRGLIPWELAMADDGDPSNYCHIFAERATAEK